METGTNRSINENILNDKPQHKLNITVLGTSGSGKTCLAYRLMSKKIPNAQDSTIEDKYKRILDVNGIPCEIEICDTAGKEENQKDYLNSWINFGDGFLMVFALNDAASLKEVERRIEFLQKVKVGKPCPILLVGNKSDLVTERDVQESEAKDKATKLGINYIETSALVMRYINK